MKALLSHLFLVVSSLCWLVLSACAPVSQQAQEAPVNGTAKPERLPVFYGAAAAPHTVLVYTNPQCPPCRRSWNIVHSLPEHLAPEHTRLVILGRGFSEEGTQLLYIAAKLAEQSPQTGMAFLSDVMSDPTALSRADWAAQAIIRHAGIPAQEQIDDLLQPEHAHAYYAMVKNVIHFYGLTHTPTVLVDGHKVERLSLDAILERLGS